MEDLFWKFFSIGALITGKQNKKKRKREQPVRSHELFGKGGHGKCKALKAEGVGWPKKKKKRKYFLLVLPYRNKRSKDSWIFTSIELGMLDWPFRDGCPWLTKRDTIRSSLSLSLASISLPSERESRLVYLERSGRPAFSHICHEPCLIKK